MDLKHRILKTAYPLLKIRNFVTNKFQNQRCGRLRVLLYHDIAPEYEDSFIAQLRWLSRSWRFVTPDHFIALLKEDEPVVEDCLLLTFDDGFISNRWIVERVLNPMDIRAIFFVVSEFVSLAENDDWRGFVVQNINPSLELDGVHPSARNMSWEDLKYLIETGHTIGAHTAHHARLSEISNTVLQSEIIDSANILEERLGIRINHFAYTFGNLDSFSSAALEISRSRFSYIYTGLRGDNATSVPPWAIRRDSMQATDHHSLIGAFLEGGADYWYSRELKTYESWGEY